MNYDYSQTMKALMKRNPGLATKILLLAMIVVLVFLSINSVISENRSIENQKANLQEFNPFSADESYSKVTLQFLSHEFASDYNDTVYYCLAIDADNNLCIVTIKADEMDKYQDVIDYTYDESITTPPAEVALQGMPKKIGADLVSYTVEAYNAFMNSNEMNSNNYQSIVGNYYLDTTQGPTVNTSGFLIYLILAVALLFIYAMIMKKAEAGNKLRKATLEKYNDYALMEVDQELNQPDTLHLNLQKVHFTNRFIVSGAVGLDIIPYEDIKQVYGVIIGKGRPGDQKAVVAVTNDDVKHEIAFAGTGSNGDQIVEQVTERIKAVMPEITYGYDDEFFYVLESKRSGFDTELDSGSGKSNVLFGIIGALAGAVIGGVLWIVIGELGFIAGLAGFLMMVFSIQGYKMLSGFLDKKGQFISLIIAFVMIFVANYSLYAIEYCKGFYDSNYSFNNIIASIKALPEFLGNGDIIGSFLKDLAVGYLLSIWAGYRLIKSVFMRNSIKNNEE